MLEDNGCMPLTAVAIDRDKNSQQAVKWAVDHLVANNPFIVLIHVRIATPQGYNGAKEGGNVNGRNYSCNEVAEMFRSNRLYCARKSMKVKEVVLDDIDVSKALIEYTNNNHLMNIVVGASNRNALTRKFRNPDVPSTLLKAAPDFCTVYVIWKGKAFTVRTPKNQASNTTGKLMIPPSPRYPTLNHVEQDEPLSSRAARGGWRVPLPITSTPDRRSIDRNAEYMKTPSRDRPLSTARTVPPKLLVENLETPVRLPRSTGSLGSFSEHLDFQRLNSFRSSDFSDSHEFSSFTVESPRSSTSPSTIDTEAEMKRLKLELKQTMDMYSNACKEAISAKQKAKELNQWKMEEARRVEEVWQAEEAALAIAETEKARCKAAIEAAQAAQRTAELETKRRLNFEFAAKREAEEKKRALDALNQNDVRYRKYSIEEIEVATDNFAKALKIGEGGYGPVYRATLEHTAVAIKVLRPDAAQGRKQFQQEVEVLCCIRHPHMVLLLGACPEYGCLVYEYMDNGSLDDRLLRRGNTPPIPWSTRFKIAAEIAAGLLFLHQAKPEPLVHRDLKPGNILLDRNYVSKIADVGLARLVPPSVADTVTQYRMTSTAGTFCYIDPEYQQTGMLGTKSDIYSLGIMLLQIITAKPPMGLAHHVKRAIDRGTFKEMLDPTIEDWPMEETLSFAKLALKCSELRRKDRPDLGAEILPELNRLRHIEDEWESSSVGSSSSLFGSTPISHSNAHPWWSQVHQERLLTNPQMGVPWSRSDAFETSKSSAAI